MTREEALKIVRENYPHFGTTEPWLDLEKALATLIPELRESEDERIRKNLIQFLRGEIHEIDVEEAIAYLEKQKEPENVSATTMAPSCWEVEQKEQKPADRFEEAREKYQVEWSEEDERMLKSTIWHISNSLTNGKNTDCKCDLTEWLKEKLKSLRPQGSKDSLQTHWKPSEEQMDALCYALQVMNTDLSPIAAKSYQGLQEIQQNLRKLM